MTQRSRLAWVDAIATEPVPPGVEYPEILETTTGRYLKPLLGVLAGVLAFFASATLVTQLMLWLGFLLFRPAGDYAAWQRAGAAFTHPWGMLSVHLGLASLIPISLALVLFVHRRHPRWLASVRPWFRWRYLSVSMLAALVVFNVFLALRGLGQPPAELRPQPDFLAFLLVILLTSPLQAAAEEFFFRGYLMQALHPLARSPWFGVVASAAIFALFHGTQNLPLYLDRFGFGLLAGVLVVRTGGLEAAIGAHVVNNVLAFTYAGLFSTIAQVKAVQQVGWIDMAWDLAGFAAFTVAALVIGRRMHLATTTPGERPRADDRGWGSR